MLLPARTARRVVAGVAGAGAVAGVMLFGAVPAMAQPAPAPPPPNCTAADLAGVSSGVAASTSGYLFTHPPVNDFFTSLEGLPRDEIKTRTEDYLNANPQVKAELQGIRQPLVDLKNRCGTATPPEDEDDTP